MLDLYSIVRPFIFLIGPEIAHKLTLKYLKLSNFFYKEVVDDPRLQTTIGDLSLSNPLGIAAGFDKNGEAILGINSLGFGFIEIGSVTPKKQTGNAKPRLFRLIDDDAIINRMGFNNIGQESVLNNIKAVRNRPIILGVNLGANKTTKNFLDDYLVGLRAFNNFVDYVVINISSPNTPGIRDLQDESNLSKLISRILAERKKINQNERSIPVILKLSPDLTDMHLKKIIDISLEKSIDALIISNTSLGRGINLRNKNKNQSGGISGVPIFSLSTKMVALAYKYSKGRLPIIGVGGISSGDDAYEKICAGASALQIYTSLVYKGPKLIKEIKKQLLFNLEKDNIKNIKDAIGCKNYKYLNKDK